MMSESVGALDCGDDAAMSSSGRFTVILLFLLVVVSLWGVFSGVLSWLPFILVNLFVAVWVVWFSGFHRRLDVLFIQFILIMMQHSLARRWVVYHDAVVPLYGLLGGWFSPVMLLMVSGVFVLMVSGRVDNALKRCYGLLDEHSLLVIVLVLGLFVRIDTAYSEIDIDLLDYVTLSQNLNIFDKNFANIYSYSGWDNHNIGKPPLMSLPILANQMVFGQDTFSKIFMTKMISMLADILVGIMLWAIVLEATRDKNKALLAAALWVMNPFIIQHSATHGKFDSVFLFLLLLALKNINSRVSSVYLAFSLGVKHAPLVLVPWLLSVKKSRMLVTSLIILALIVSPIIIHNPSGFFKQMITNHVEIQHYYHSWYVFIERCRDITGIQLISHEIIAPLMFLVLGILCILISHFLKPDPYSYLAFSFAFIILVMPAIYRQELIWCLPFFIICYFKDKGYASSMIPFSLITFIGIYRLMGYWNLLLSMALVYFIIDSFIIDLVEAVKEKIRA
ncbi:hypothetical protein ACFLRF_02585 [Candidatus Altiarchaeota archaeon]